jgi:hypothetical protein
MKGKRMNGQRQKSIVSQEAAEQIAIAALGFIASEPERLDRFLSITGLGPDTLRAAASQKGFLGQILSHLADDESLLLAFAANVGESPASIAAAHQTLNRPASGGDET